MLSQAIAVVAGGNAVVLAAFVADAALFQQNFGLQMSQIAATVQFFDKLVSLNDLFCRTWI